eukprot:5431816-Pyramimonas_sp.AAC.1
MAAALSKHLIAKRLAVGVLASVGRTAPAVLLASMAISIFASMWISNVAAPVRPPPLHRNIPRRNGPVAASP